MLKYIKGWRAYAALIGVFLFFFYAGWLGYQLIESELTESTFSSHQSIARLAATTLDEKFDSLTGIAVALATRVKFRELIMAGEWQQAIQILASVPRDFPFVERVFLTDPAGTEMADMPALTGGVGKNFAFRDWYKGVSTNWQPYISRVYKRTASPRRNLFAVAVPVKSDNGRILGILVLQINLPDFFSWTDRLDIGPEGLVYIVDGGGRLAHHPRFPDQGEIIDYSTVPLVRKALTSRESSIAIGADPITEEKQISAYVPVDYGWGVVVQRSAESAFAYKNRQLMWLAIGYGLILIFILVVMLLLMRVLRQHMRDREYQRVQEELEEQWQFFRKVIDIDSNMIFVKDDQGRFVLVNQAVADVFGTSVDNMVGKTNGDFIPNKVLVDKFYRDEQEVIKNQKEKFIPEIVIHDVKGNTRCLQVVMRPITSVDGNSNMVLGVSSDITERVKMESRLRHNIERFEIIARATNDAIWDWFFEDDSLWWNESFRTLFGYKDEDIESNIDFWKENIHDADRDRIVTGLEAAIAAGKKYWEDEYRFRRKDGSYAHVHDHGYILHDDRGKAYRMLGSLKDTTEHHEQQEKIERLTRIRTILSEINHAIVQINDRKLLLQETCRICVEHGGFEFAWISLLDDLSQDIKPVASYGESHGYLESVGFSARADRREGQSLTGRTLREKQPLVSNMVETDSEVIYSKELIERGFKSMVALPMLVQDRAIGTLSLYSQNTNIFDAEEIELLKELVSDVTFALDYLDKEDKVQFLAYYDALTGLPNRDLFLDRLKQYLHSLNDTGIAGVLLIDIERFSYINEVYGHEIGDQLLKKFSSSLQNIVPDADYVARLASNTFSVLLIGVRSAADIANFIEQKLLRHMSRQIPIKDTDYKISVRIGVVILPDDGAEPEVLIKNAEAALKSAKKSGNKYLFYSREMNARVADKLALENKLRTALEQNQFILYYQPKINLANNSICGLEALIRWDSDNGLVSPDKFVPILEETGLILDVGQWVLTQVRNDYYEWMAKKLNPPPIAVNISAVELKQKNFVDRVAEIVLQDASEAPWLEFEVTETVIMEELDENVQKLDALRARKIGISIDDFGTGYSSLRYMSRLPVTSLKIDKSFTANLIRSADDTEIVIAVIQLAHSLKLEVIAEGVESDEQLNLLRQFNCDQYQGYLFSPPLPRHDIERLLSESRHSN